MKVLFDCHVPFLLAHGGAQIQIEQTKKALVSLGIDVEHLRWWDGSQRGELIHFFGAAPSGLVQAAALQGLPVVMTNLFTSTCNRSDLRLQLQGALIRTALRAPIGGAVVNQLPWGTFKKCSHNIVGLTAERRVLEVVYDVPKANISVIPLGLPDAFLNAGHGRRSEPHLICVGTITRRKNSISIARLAKEVGVPILFVGNPYHPGDAYWQNFKSLVDGQFVRHQPHVGDEKDLIRAYQNARGFVLMSDYENWCLVAHEAAACGLPLLLPDQKWSRERFGNHASYFPASRNGNSAQALREFYDRCPNLKAPEIKLHSWTEAAQGISDVYRRVLSTSS